MRGIFSIIMVSLFAVIIKMGATWLMALVRLFFCGHQKVRLLEDLLNYEKYLGICHTVLVLP